MQQGSYALFIPLPMNKLRIGLTAREVIIPIVPADGGFIPPKYNTIQTANPMIPELIAPVRVAPFQSNPQINGPRKNDPKAPQEILRIATMVSRSSHASITERKTKNALPIRMSLVRRLSDAFGLMNP